MKHLIFDEIGNGPQGIVGIPIQFWDFDNFLVLTHFTLQT
jgi:hypothetical protein